MFLYNIIILLRDMRTLQLSAYDSECRDKIDAANRRVIDWVVNEK